MLYCDEISSLSAARIQSEFFLVLSKCINCVAGGLNDSGVGYGLSAELRLLCMSAACLDWVYLCNVIDRISVECCLDPLQF